MKSGHPYGRSCVTVPLIDGLCTLIDSYNMVTKICNDLTSALYNDRMKTVRAVVVVQNGANITHVMVWRKMYGRLCTEVTVYGGV